MEERVGEIKKALESNENKIHLTRTFETQKILKRNFTAQCIP
jgi:hypothetical protein